MRIKNNYTSMSVTREIHERIKKDRDYFQETIGGGKWSLSDTITEYLKIICMFEDSNGAIYKKNDEK